VIAVTQKQQKGSELRGHGGRFHTTCKIATILLI